MSTYLAKRGATYYFRRAIPTELRAGLGGRAEFMISLRTKDREAAKRLIPAQTIATDRLLEEARSKVSENWPPRPPEPRSEAAARYEAAAMEHSLESAEIANRDAAEQEERQALRDDEREYWRRRMGLSTKILSHTEAAVKDLLSEKDFDLELARNELSHLRAQLRRARKGGDPNLIGMPAAPSRSSASVAPALSAFPATGSSSALYLDKQIVDGWAAERKPQPKTIDAHRAAARWFYERITEKPIGEITRADVIKFKTALIDEGQSAPNIRTKLQRLRTLLQWAFENDHAAANAGDGITMRDTSNQKPRLEYDVASLNRIFSSPVYSEGLRPKQGCGEAAYWLPLLSLFSGGRLEELGQLRPKDVVELTFTDADEAEQRAHFIRMIEDQEDGLTLKNAGSERLVPVHPELERLGFIEFVEAAREAGHARLFPLLRPNKYGTLTAKWGEWYSDYRRNVCGITDRRMVFHSFRHAFKQYARHVGMEEGVQRQIMGHSSSDVADDYGSGYPLHRIVEGMKLYRVPGLRLPMAIDLIIERQQA